MVRMLIHAGFHKTGTTSVQKMLAQNKKALYRESHVFLRRHIKPVCEAARTFSASRQKQDLLLFSYELSSFLEGLNDRLDRNICISSEDLCGHMPGRRDIRTYDAAPILMKAFVHTVEKTMPNPPEMVFYLSTRAANSWLRSCYSQHVGVVRMTMTPEAYSEAYAESARLDRIVDMVRLAVAPHRFETRSLEVVKDTPLGPLTPILDILDISPEIRSRLKPLPPANVAVPDVLQQEFLRLNRSNLSYEDVRRAKALAQKDWFAAGKADTT